MHVITEAQVRALVDVDDMIDALAAAFAGTSEPATVNLPRERLYSGTTRLNLMGGVLGGTGRIAIKAYTTGPHSAILLFDADGTLLALVESRTLSLLRTAAASAVAADRLGRSDATRLGIIGTGWQAAGQLRAIASVRPLTEVRVWSPTPDHVRDFSTTLGAELGIDVVPAGSAREAVAGLDLVVTASKAAAPVVEADWIAPGTHLTLMGANQAHRREVTEAVIGTCDLITVDDVVQARRESGDLMAAVDTKTIKWEEVVAFGDVVSGKAAGRTDDEQVTLFKSLGVGIEDVAAASLAYDLARAAGSAHST